MRPKTRRIYGLTDVAVGPGPAFIADAFERMLAGPVVAAWQRDAGLAVGPLPAYFAGAVIRRSAFTVDAAFAVVLADGFGAGIELIAVVLVVGLSPSGLADDVAVGVADVFVGALQQKVIPKLAKKVAYLH